jgi:hypothetical protein
MIVNMRGKLGFKPVAAGEFRDISWCIRPCQVSVAKALS